MAMGKREGESKKKERKKENSEPRRDFPCVEGKITSGSTSHRACEIKMAAVEKGFYPS